MCLWQEGALGTKLQELGAAGAARKGLKGDVQDERRHSRRQGSVNGSRRCCTATCTPAQSWPRRFGPYPSLQHAAGSWSLLLTRWKCITSALCQQYQWCPSRCSNRCDHPHEGRACTLARALARPRPLPEQQQQQAHSSYMHSAASCTATQAAVEKGSKARAAGSPGDHAHDRRRVCVHGPHRV